MQFLYDCDTRPARVSSWLKQLRSEAETDPTKKKDLAELCAVGVANKLKPHYYWGLTGDQADRPNKTLLRDQACAAALQCGELDLYGKMVEGSVESLPLEVFRLLGWVMVTALQPESLWARYGKQKISMGAIGREESANRISDVKRRCPSRRR